MDETTNEKPPNDPVTGAQVIEVIEVIATRGTGDVERFGEADRARRVRRYFSKGGDLLAEHDHHGTLVLRDRVKLAERAREDREAFYKGIIEEWKITTTELQNERDEARRTCADLNAELDVELAKNARQKRTIEALRARLKPYLVDEALSKRGAITPPHLREVPSRKTKRRK